MCLFATTKYCKHSLWKLLLTKLIHTSILFCDYGSIECTFLILIINLTKTIKLSLNLFNSEKCKSRFRSYRFIHLQKMSFRFPVRHAQQTRSKNPMYVYGLNMLQNRFCVSIRCANEVLFRIETPADKNKHLQSVLSHTVLYSIPPH